jgi:hypothetical protein
VERKAVLIRIDPALHDALQAWAAADLRSFNGQVEYLLRRAAVESGRLPRAQDGAARRREND